MKQFFLSLGLLAILANGSAMAANETVVAEKVLSAGFRPPTAPHALGLRVFEDGRVVAFTSFDDSRLDKINQVATLSGKAVLKLKTELKTLKSVKLKNTSTGPACQDAPMIVYRGLGAEGKLVELQAQIGCQLHVRSDNANVYQVPTLLDGLGTLAD